MCQAPLVWRKREIQQIDAIRIGTPRTTSLTILQEAFRIHCHKFMTANEGGRARSKRSRHHLPFRTKKYRNLAVFAKVSRCLRHRQNMTLRIVYIDVRAISLLLKRQNIPVEVVPHSVNVVQPGRDRDLETTAVLVYGAKLRSACAI